MPRTTIFLSEALATGADGLRGQSLHNPAQRKRTMTTKTITIRARAFSGEGVREHRVQVDGKTVRVWDSVAGHYTTCHSLSKSALRRILAARMQCGSCGRVWSGRCVDLSRGISEQCLCGSMGVAPNEASVAQ